MTMQCSLENTSSLAQKMTITVPAAEVAEAMEAHLQRIARDKRNRVKGFRPGKVPMPVIRQQFAAEAHQEAVHQLIQKSLGEALESKKIIPVGMPHMHDVEAKMGEDLRYVAHFEVYPEIKYNKDTKLKLEKISTTVTDADEQFVIDKLREQNKTWKTVQRPAKNGDRLIVNFTSEIEGKAPDAQDKGEGMQVVLGSGGTIPGFEEGLVGVKPGEDKTLSLTFPADYHSAPRAGKAATFHLHVLEVAEGELPEVTEDFVKKFGIESGDIAKLRSEIRGTLEREVKTRVQAGLKEQVMNQLLEQYPIEVPHLLVQQEAEDLSQKTQQQMQSMWKGQQAGANKKMPELPLSLFMERAKRRVALGLLLQAAVKEMELKVEDQHVDRLLNDMAQSYSEPEQWIKWYKTQKQPMNEIRALALEELLVEKMISNAHVEEKHLTYQELMKQGEAKA